MPEPFLAILSHSSFAVSWCFSSQASYASREANGIIGRSGLVVMTSPFDYRCRCAAGSGCPLPKVAVACASLSTLATLHSSSCLSARPSEPPPPRSGATPSLASSAPPPTRRVAANWILVFELGREVLQRKPPGIPRWSGHPHVDHQSRPTGQYMEVDGGLVGVGA